MSSLLEAPLCYILDFCKFKGALSSKEFPPRHNSVCFLSSRSKRLICHFEETFLLTFCKRSVLGYTALLAGQNSKLKSGKFLPPHESQEDLVQKFGFLNPVTFRSSTLWNYIQYSYPFLIIFEIKELQI